MGSFRLIRLTKYRDHWRVVLNTVFQVEEDDLYVHRYLDTFHILHISAKKYRNCAREHSGTATAPIV